MRKVPYLLTATILVSLVSTGCAKRNDPIIPNYPQQNMQPISAVPANPNPAYSQIPESNLVDSTPQFPLASEKKTSTTEDMATKANDVSKESTSTPSTTTPSTGTTTPAPAPKEPWYKKIITKVKGIFSKKK